ncbi:short-chain fatty acid transporter [Allopusillimonas soli]|uniref:Short-chain fatty acid transporter n=1 Tax=Allopusillimonas soli TaxID=659016 RepID=A0A853F916_9BURK|nr:short-chain fatty acid transporter [Allopusillimonas soli]NYT37165.1 short-chain fatty acid transporter [Allopusillimonas soli]TEA74833.1 short-chain fatty acid transporter [Allopusillimonas soli]
MFKALSRYSVKLVERYLPDPYIFVVLLTLIAGVAAVSIEHRTPMEVVTMWGDGFWGLLSFTMQMVLVLVAGYMMASTPAVRRILETLSRLAGSPGSAIVLVTVVALAANWLNWGFGLVVSALFAKQLARSIKVDYRLLVASAYSGFVVWHGGLAGSIPLTIATEGHFQQDKIGLISTSDTIFSTFNLVIVLAMFVVVPLVNRLMMPDEKDSVYVDRAVLDDGAVEHEQDDRPAARLENSRLLAMLIGFCGLAYLFNYYVIRQGGLNLNVINFTFLFLAIVLHGNARNLLDSLNDAIKGAAGIVIQFPFYAGIMAIIMHSGLAASLSGWMTSLASAASLPFWTFMSAGIVNIFIPSGGGQWAVQSPVVIASAQALGADMPRVAMAVAWGDAWTNLLQPFWALPVLAIAGLKAKDIMGYCLIQLLVTGIIVSIGLSFF